MTYPRDFKGVWIPKDIWLHTELSFLEKCLAAEIDSLDGDDGCYASNQYFMNLFGLKESTIRNAIGKLKKLNLVKQVGFDGRERILRGYSKLRVSPQTDSGQTAEKPAGRPSKYQRSRTKNIHIEERKEERKDKSAAGASEINNLLFKKLKERNPKFKIKSKKAWERNTKKLLKQYSKEEACEVVEWIFTADHPKAEFWRDVIQSPESLYNNIDKIIIQKNHKTKAQSEKEQAHAEAKRIEENRDWARDILAPINFGYDRYIRQHENHVEIKNGNEMMPLGFKELNFKDIITHKLRSWELI